MISRVHTHRPYYPTPGRTDGRGPGYDPDSSALGVARHFQPSWNHVGAAVMKRGSRQAGTNQRARGTNPRALGTNPKALGTNPRANVRNKYALRNWKRKKRSKS
jgi:hypothetical protein